MTENRSRVSYSPAITHYIRDVSLMTQQPPPVSPTVGKEFLDSLANGLRVLQMYSRNCHALTIQDVADQQGMTRAAARRILLTLSEIGYLRQIDRHFLITPKVLNLGFAYFASLDLAQRMRPALQRAAHALEETCSLGALEGTDIVFLCREQSPKPFKLDLHIGSRLPAYAHSMGHALLSQLDDAEFDDYLRRVTLKPLTSKTITSRQTLKQHIQEVREQGYSLCVDELVEGFAGVSLPLPMRQGTHPLAISASMVLGRRSRSDLLKHFLPALRDAATEICAMQPDLH